MTQTQIFAARWILPVDAPPIDEGEIVIEQGAIAAVRPRRSPASECRELGESVIMPGFVNAHTHLEYTALRGFLEDVPFFPWLRALTAAKAALTPDGWLCSARLGALESVAAGVTTIGDNTDSGATMQAADEAGLRGVVYQEVFGIDDRLPVGPILAELDRRLAALRERSSDRLRIGVSPHALYTVRPELMAGLNAYCADNHLAASMHLAESLPEVSLTLTGNGPFAEMLASRGISWNAPRITPTAFAAMLGALRYDVAAVHCIHQSPEDISLLAESGAAVVHCPKSNAKLGAGIAPLSRWLRTPGLRIGLGTDSAVSNNSLNLFEEMRFAVLLQRGLEAAVEAVDARQVVRIATLGGAEVLGLDTVTGSLTPGKRADLIAVRMDRAHCAPVTDIYAGLVYAARPDDVVFTMCDGVPLYDSGDWLTLNRRAVLQNARTVRAGIDAATPPAAVGIRSI